MSNSPLLLFPSAVMSFFPPFSLPDANRAEGFLHQAKARKAESAGLPAEETQRQIQCRGMACLPVAEKILRDREMSP